MNVGSLTYGQFECLCIETASNSNVTLSDSVRLGDSRALARVTAARNKNSVALDLTRLPMESFPAELFELDHLRTLRLNSMGLSRLPADLHRLSSLTALRVAHNLFVSVPPSLHELPSLTEIDLSFNSIASLSSSLQTLKIIRIEVNHISEIPGECSAFTRLEHLNMSHNDLEILPGPVISHWLNLQVLNLGDNQLEAVPLEITQLQCLSELDLSHNHLTSLPDQLVTLPLTHLRVDHNALEELPDSWATFSNLRKFDCSHNSIMVIPDGLTAENLDLSHNIIGSLGAGFVGVESLTCTHNLISEISPECWHNMTALSRLDLSYNFQSAISEHVSSVSKLTYFDVAFNEIERIHDNVNNLSRLLFFSATGNKLEKVPNGLLDLPHINFVRLGANYISTIPPVQATHPLHLQSLYLGNNNLTSNCFQAISALTGLMTLDIGYNGLCSVSSSIRRLSNLTSLHLAGNQLASIPKCIFALQQLRDLYLGNNLITNVATAISRLTNLVVLDCNTNALSSMDSVMTLENLQWLDISNNVSLTVPEEVIDLPNLQELYTHRTTIPNTSRICNALPRLRHGIHILGSRFCVSSADMRGNRSSMEDSSVVHGSLADIEGVDFFAVLDGHSGRVTAEFVGTALLNTTINTLTGLAGKLDSFNPMEFLPSAFQSVTSQLRLHDIGQDEGSTAVVALFVGLRLFIANVGDARAVLSRKKKAVRISFDHKPGLPAERERIRGLGGFVDDNGRVNGIVGVSRSFGDFSLQPFINFFPHMSVTDIHPSDEFVILACDGVWDVMTDQEAVDIVSSVGPDSAATVLRDHAFMKGSDDNISVIVITLEMYDSLVTSSTLCTSQRIVPGMPEDELSTVLCALGVDIMKEEIRRSAKNFIISPVCTSIPWLLLMDAASGDTKMELGAFLASGESSMHEQAEMYSYFFKELLADLNRKPEDMSFHHSSAIYVNGKSINRSFGNEFEPEVFGAVRSIRSDDVVSVASLYFMQKTKGEVSLADLPRFPKNAIMPISVTTLRVAWGFCEQYPRIEVNRQSGPFFISTTGGCFEGKDCEFFAVDSEWMVYETEQLKCVSVPLGTDGTLSAVLVSPANAAEQPQTVEQACIPSLTLSELVSTLTADGILSIMYKATRKQCVLRIPHLRQIESTLRLKEALSNLGMTLPFNQSAASFDGLASSGSPCLNDRRLHVSDAVHVTRLRFTDGHVTSDTNSCVSNLDCRGTTRLQHRLVAQRSLAQLFGQSHVLSFDHPFLMAVVDNRRGAIMFISSVFDVTNCM